jgi:amino acid adenylation domain-containing protein
VHLPRGPESVIALLAVLRCGGIYVPLDHSYPEEYLELFLKDTGARIIVSAESKRSARLCTERTLVAIDDLDDAIGTQEQFHNPVSTSDPCLVLYTSGSTGRPKGVVHCQRQIINRLHWMWETYPFKAADVLAQRSPVSVMPSMWELLGGILGGTPTVVVPDRALRDPAALLTFLARYAVSFITVTPTVLEQVIRAHTDRTRPRIPLRVVVIGGEPVHDDLIRRFEQIYPEATMVDDFGATEVNTVLHRTCAGSAGGPHLRGYRPIANVSAVIVDERLNLVPRGVEGELCVGGVPLALEYHNRPEQTAQRFVAGDQPHGRSGRLYRTGDVAVMNRDGSITVTGRRDHQVKVSGFRVELGEVERVLASHPAVSRCAVVQRGVAGRRVLVACVTGRAGATAADDVQLRSFLAERLPRHMLPARFEWRDALPRRPNGKLDRLALADAEGSARQCAETDVRAAVADLLGMDPSAVDTRAEFAALGIDSVAMVQLADRLTALLGRLVTPTMLYDHPSIGRLLDALGMRPPDARQHSRSDPPHDAVAIVGISGCFAGAKNIDELWRQLCEGVESISTSASGRWSAEEIYDADESAERGSISKWGGFLAGADEFDPAFFGISAAEARVMDPQQRLALMAAWHALEDGGYTGYGVEGETVGVFVGAREPDYPAHLRRAGVAPSAETLLGNELALIAARISHFCNFCGPSLVVATACSSGLVAVHLAIRSLEAGECTMALAGGVCVTNDPDFYIATSKMNVFSGSGRCRAFDERADGFVHGEGVGFVLLKPLARALSDRDHIYAAILGSALNQDGRSNGITAPNGQSQTALQEGLYRRLGLDPATIAYVEAHGTGTALGDPIEVQALTRTFRRFTLKRQYCAIGSIKTNVGHSTAAAGIAGLIKIALCLYHRQLVPSLNFTTPNKWLDLENSPFYVNTTLTRWESPDGRPRRAALNSFGIGGTNAHMVLEEAPASAPPADSDDWSELPVQVSGRDDAAAMRALMALDQWLTVNGRTSTLLDISYSLVAGRRIFDYGYLFISRDTDDLHAQIRSVLDGTPHPRVQRIAPGETPVTNWRDLYERLAPRRVPLPGYPFMADRFWVDVEPEPHVERKMEDTLPTGPTPSDVVAEVAADVLGFNATVLSGEDTLSGYGLDSLRAISLKHRLERRTGRTVPLALLMRGASIDEIAAAIDSADAPPAAADVWQTFGDPSESFALTDLQAAHFVAKHMPEVDPVGAHVYVEFPVPDLDVDRLESAWGRLVQLHPMLRARIETDGRQCIRPESPPASFIRYDLAPEHELQPHLDRVRMEMAHKVYLPGAWPLYDIRVTRHPSAPPRVHVSMDSWIVDGASATLLHAQWRRMYSSPEVQIASPAATFRDFTLNMKEREKTIEYRRALEYWSRKLAACPSGPWLPPADPASLSPLRGRRRRLHRRWPADEWHRLRERLASNHVTASAALLALFSEHLRNAGCGERFALILTVYNRPFLHPHIADVVGPFSSTAIFIVEDDSVGPLLARARQCQRQLVQDLEHASVSGVAVRRESGAAAEAASRVVFTSAVGLDANMSLSAGWLDDVDFAVSQTPGIDLHVQIYERRDGFHLAWDVADRLDTAVMDELFDQMCAGVTELVTRGIEERDVPLALRVLRERRRGMLEQTTVDAAAGIALSPLQQAYVAHRLISGEARPAFVYRAVDVAGFDAPRMQAALNTLLDNSPLLRSALIAQRSRFVEFSNAACPLLVENTDRGDDVMRRDMEAGLKKQDWPPFYVRAQCRPDGSARVHIMLDPVVFDGYGVWLFVEDLLQRYDGSAANKRRGGLTYAQYAQARARYAVSSGFTCDRMYWARKFRVSAPGPRWVADGTEPSGAGVRYETEFDGWDALVAAASARELDPGAVVASVYAEVLRRSSSTDPLTVVVVDFGQRHLAPDLATLYGDFSSLSWVRYHELSYLTVEQAARRTAHQLARDRLHDWGNPFEAVRSLPAEEREFTAVLTDCRGAPAMDHDSAQIVSSESHTPGVKLDLVVIDAGGRLRSAWQSSASELQAGTVRAMADQFRLILAELAGDESAWGQPLRELGNSRTQLQGEREVWNYTDREFDREQSIHGLFEAQASRHPERTAVVADTVALSYGELDRRACQLARHLRRLGVRDGSHVAVLLDRSFDLIVALLAVLKAGAAYLPLPLADPESRRAAMLRRAQANVMITSEAHNPPTNRYAKVILLDRQKSAIDAESGERLHGVNVSSSATAYIMFTSGSTGEPKGVVVRHRPIVNLIEWAGRTFDFDEHDRVLFVNSTGFDLSVFDIFGLLAYGGSIRIVADADLRDPLRLAHILTHEPITFWNSAPAYLQFIMPALSAPPGQQGSLRLTFLSGDWIPLSLPDQLRTVFPNTRVIALGGATEATVWSNFFEVRRIDPRWRSIPYGQPIHNARYYVLNEQMQRCSAGTPGELYIGGECVASGYVNAPEVTASRFVADPFHERPGMTMYRTGDLVRAMEDGNLEFLGRADDQFKLRGFRIEPAEIEAALAQAGLANPVAVGREDTPGNRTIVAFGTRPGAGGLIDDPDLRRRVSELLPEFMAPSKFYALPKLPITTNGKVDRRRLATAPIDELAGGESAGQIAAFASPDNSTLEDLVRTALSEILSIKREEVQPKTHFSLLGINSLHYALLSARIGQATGRVVSPARLFRCSSAAEVVDALRPSTMPTAARAPASGQRSDGLAVIGMYCLMPGAADADSFWTNLVDGRDATELVPPDRWNWRKIYGDSARRENVTTANRAGFLRNIDRFDAVFFGISPREAELIDPRQRLLLEGVWAMLECAGHRPSELRGRPVGVFIGALGDEYGSMLQRAGVPVDQFSLTGNARSLLANRVSYYYGWHGPSEVVDTTCSSSLVALHNARRAIATGDCAMAVVGGVNIMMDPEPHLQLSKVGVLSPDGICRPFDAAANGYVRGEGLGLILVRPLADAEADGDLVHAVIAGTAVNHGGRANSLTAPNPRAQAQVIAEAHRQSGVSPRQVGYIEAHGTGTLLGDPTEIHGLREAFTAIARERGEELPPEGAISVGSVKANIGHLEGAAGVSGVIKVILMLHRQVLPPLAHFSAVNPQIEIDGTPFRFDRIARRWETPTDQSGTALPRAAGVSSFGFGGVNAHAVLLEHVPPPSDTRSAAADLACIFPISARTPAELQRLARRLRDALLSEGSRLRLEDIAFTLQDGREAFETRAAIVTESLDALIAALDSLAECRDTQVNGADIFQPGLTEIPAGPRQRVATWVSGETIDWRGLWGTARPFRVALPTYPFSSIRYWPSALVAAPVVPALVERERGTYAVTLTGEAFFIADHRLHGRPLVPAAAYLELIGQVAFHLFERRPFTIRGVSWTHPLSLADTSRVDLEISVEPRGPGQLAVIRDRAGTVDCASAVVEAAPPVDNPVVSISSIRGRCARTESADACYVHLSEAGFEYGAALRVIVGFSHSPSEAFARVVLPPKSRTGGSGCALHPALVDGAFQTAMLHYILNEQETGSVATHVPFTARQIRKLGEPTDECFVHVRREPAEASNGLPVYTMAIMNGDGDVAIEIKECVGVPLKRTAARGESASTRLYEEHWEFIQAPATAKSANQSGAAHVTIGLPELADALAGAGYAVLGNAVLPPSASRPAFARSALPWDRILAGARCPRDLVLWYDADAVGRMPPEEQLRFGFESVAAAVTRLLREGPRQAARVQVVLRSKHDRAAAPSLAALAAFARVAQIEHPCLRMRTVRCVGDFSCSPLSELPLSLDASGAAADGARECVEYLIDLGSGTHAVRRLIPQGSGIANKPLPVERGAVYLITGGAGGIGRRLARTLLQQGATAVAIGRSVPPPDFTRTLSGAVYFQTDVTDTRSLTGAVSTVHNRYGPIRGVFHCAGAISGSLLLRRSEEQARRIVSPKAAGAIALDAATVDEPLDFFVLFSSLATAIGPVGLADYAYANRFLEAYAVQRAALVRDGRRRGRTLAVSWPVWSDGGMRVPPADAAYLRSRGLVPIDSPQAMRVLAACMSSDCAHVVCAHGEPEKFESFLRIAVPVVA